MKGVSDLLSYTGKTKEEKRSCPKHGEYTALLTQFGNKWLGGTCPQCHEESLATREAPIETINSVIPKRFKHCTFDNYQVGESRSQKLALAICKKYAECFEDRHEQGGGLILHGSCGTGKTHLAVAIAKTVNQKHLMTVEMVKVYDLTNDVKSTWSSQSQFTETQIIAKYTKPDLLIIDEIGVQFESEAEKMILFRVINRRYEDMKPTILISNLNLEELNKCLDERIIDRMQEGGGSRIVFDWASHRGEII